MNGDYAHDHPRASLPDLRFDNKLSAEAHGLLDNGNNWREELRSTQTFTGALLSIADKTLDKNGDGKFSDGELTAFVNDFHQSNLAREAVQLLRENPVLVRGKVSLAEIAYDVDQGMLAGADKATFRKDTLRKADIENAKFTGGALGVIATGTAIAATSMGPEIALVGGLFAIGPLLIGGATYYGDHVTGSRLIKHAIEKNQVLQPLDLFDQHAGDIEPLYDYKQIQKNGGQRPSATTRMIY